VSIGLPVFNGAAYLEEAIRSVLAQCLDDLELELEEFNRAFDVKAKDRRFAVALVDQRMMRFLLGTDPAFAFEACGRWLLCSSKRRRPSELVPLLGTLKGFRDHVPRVVFDLYRPDASG